MSSIETKDPVSISNRSGQVDIAPTSRLSGTQWSSLATPRSLTTVLVIVLLAVVPFTADSFTVSNFALVLIYGVALLSLDIVNGYAGQVSLGHGGLMALGAYTSSILMVKADVNAYLTLLVSPLVTAVLGLVFAVSALRLAGMYLGLATFALAFTVPQFARQFTSFAGGSEGLILPFQTSPIGALSDTQWLYLLFWSIAVLAFIVQRLFVTGRVGRALGAIRERELAAKAVGVNIRNYKIAAFFVSSLLAGLSGALFALNAAFVSPDSYSFGLSLILFVGLGVAGLRSIAGPLVGALFIVYLPLLAGDIYAGKPDIAYGAIIVVMVLLGRGGLIDLSQRVWEFGLRAVREST
jgi:branched-chain amino acid transport system permease protein